MKKLMYAIICILVVFFGTFIFIVHYVSREYVTMQKIDLGDGYFANIYGENFWEISRPLFLEISRDGVVCYPRFSWALSNPSQEPYEFKVYDGDGGRYVAVAEASAPHGIIILYDKKKNILLKKVKVELPAQTPNLHWAFLRRENHCILSRIAQRKMLVIKSGHMQIFWT